MMVQPGIANNYFPFPNDLAEAFARLQLSGIQWRLIFVILRQTYGWHKECERISLSTFAKKTNLADKGISRAMKDLIDRGLVKRDESSYVRTYSLQMNYALWKLSPKLGIKPSPKLGIAKNEDLKNEDADRPKLGIKPSPKLARIKEKKETSKKNIFAQDSPELQISSFLLKKIKEHKPDFREPNLQTWASDFQLLLRKDKRDPQRVMEVVAWAQANSFWCGVVLSARKLRDKFDQIEIQMNEAAKSGGDGGFKSKTYRGSRLYADRVKAAALDAEAEKINRERRAKKDLPEYEKSGLAETEALVSHPERFSQLVHKEISHYIDEKYGRDDLESG